MIQNSNPLTIETPEVPDAELFSDPVAAVDRLEKLYRTATRYLTEQFSQAAAGKVPTARHRAYYPEIRVTTTSFAAMDTRLSFGHVSKPGSYSTTITRPDLFRNYLIQQITQIVHNHGVSVSVGASNVPMPVHFAVANDESITIPQEGAMDYPLRG